VLTENNFKPPVKHGDGIVMDSGCFTSTQLAVSESTLNLASDQRVPVENVKPSV